MDEINHRLEGFDENVKQKIAKYLNRCLTKYFKSQVNEFKNSLRYQGIPEHCIEREVLLRMATFDLITMDEAKRRMGSC